MELSQHADREPKKKKKKSGGRESAVGWLPQRIRADENGILPKCSNLIRKYASHSLKAVGEPTLK